MEPTISTLDYSTLPALNHVVLEESFVLEIRRRNDGVVFDMDLVLLEGHESYAPPGQGEAYCFRRGILTLHSNGEPHLNESGSPPARGADGETDLGHIDSFKLHEGSWRLVGDWGSLVLVGNGVKVEIEDS